MENPVRLPPRPPWSPGEPLREVTSSSLTTPEAGTELPEDPVRLCGWLALLAFMLVMIGRIQELLPALAPIRLGLVSGGLAGLAWLYSSGSFSEKVPFDVKQVRYVLALLGLAIATLPVAVWPGHSFEFVTQQYSKTVLLFLLVLYWCRSLRNIRGVIWVCCLGAIGSVVTGLVSGQVGDQRFNAGSLTYDPNDLAWLLVTILPMLVYLYYTSGAATRVLLAGMTFLCFYGIVLTQSRGGLLALLVVCLLLWRRILPSSGTAGIAVMALVVFGVLAGSAYWDRIETMWDPRSEYDRTLGGRTVLWETGLALLIAHPWGVGIDGFVTAEGLSHGGGGKWSASHNSLLQVGVELGAAGLVVFLLLVGRTARDLRLVQSSPRSSPFWLANGADGITPNWDPPEPGTTEDSLRDGVPLLAGALEISLWGLIASGFFLSQGYSPLLYVVLGLSVACVRLAQPTDASDEAALSFVAPTMSPFRTPPL